MPAEDAVLACALSSPVYCPAVQVQIQFAARSHLARPAFLRVLQQVWAMLSEMSKTSLVEVQDGKIYNLHVSWLIQRRCVRSSCCMSQD